MNTKDMRAALKDVVEVVPRNNEDVVALFKEKFPEVIVEDAVEKAVVEEVEEEVWTYVGSGHEPPQVTNFMGRQVFMRGHPVKVTDPLVLMKIKNHGCFVKGTIKGEKLIEQDQKEKTIFEQKRLENERIQRNAELMFKG
jgi:hypothetical protein